MIPVTTSMSQVDTFTESEEIEFSIGDPRWVMRTQADLYSNRELAVAREYSTNAYDANLERALTEGTDVRPIEVTLPGPMNGTFKVRDFGLGMSRDMLANTFTKFGTSTKRNSNNYNGVLGYGSKSAVAYTDNFTVTSIHEGVKTVALITRKPDWSIVMKIVKSSKTTEESGTEISVPVHNWEQFSTVANDFYAFWLPGRVVVNGKSPAHNVGDKIADNFYYSPTWDRSYIVMGNVPYRVENAGALFNDTKMNPINFVIYVDNGDVEFTPSREDLKYTDKTVNTLTEILDKFSVSIIDIAQDEVTNAKTHTEAYKNWRKWTSVLGMEMFDSLEFKGEVFQNKVQIRGHLYNVNGYRNSVRSIRDWDVESFEKAMVVTEFNISVSSNSKAKAKEYMEMVGWDMRYVIFTPQESKDIESPWIDRTMFVTWDSLKTALPKKPRAARTTISGRIPGSYDYWDCSDNSWKVGQPVPAGEVRYISVYNNKRYNPKNIASLAGYTGSIVVLSENRIAKFKRENPQAPNFIVWARDKVVKNSITLLSQDAQTLLSYPDTVIKWAKKFDMSQIDDPAWAEVVRLAAQRDSLLRDYNNNQTLANAVGMGYNVTKRNISVDTSLLKKYELLDGFSVYGTPPSLKHLYLYMNAVFAAESEKSND